MSEGIAYKAGSAKVLWIIATASEPLRVEEIYDALETDATKGTVKASVRRLYKGGLLVRRKDRLAPKKRGPIPYEYTLAPREA